MANDGLVAEEADNIHPCPVCGFAWRVQKVFVPYPGGQGLPNGIWHVPQGGGQCSNPDCPATVEELDAIRAHRRSQSWDL